MERLLDQISEWLTLLETSLVAVQKDLLAVPHQQ
jgi:hypothetical protein